MYFRSDPVKYCGHQTNNALQSELDPPCKRAKYSPVVDPKTTTKMEADMAKNPQDALGKRAMCDTAAWGRQCIAMLHP